ncbi:MAG: TPM domain-containing protein [Bacteroidia bacterium]
MIKKYFSILFFLLFSSASIIAQSQTYEGIPDRPNPPVLVNNLSKQMPDFLSASDQAQLEKKLDDFANETSNQISVVIVDDLAGLEAWDFATRLGQKWGVGQNKFSNGIVVLIKPTGGKGQRDSYIAVGYGLEGAIPDATCNQIKENELIPNLANGDYYKALDKTTDVLMALAKGEYNSADYAKKHSSGHFPAGLIIPIIFIIIFIIMRASGGGGRGNGGMSMGTGFFLGSMFGGGGGSWGGGGGSSGGFGGFGGGGFGGGGAGGKW